MTSPRVTDGWAQRAGLLADFGERRADSVRIIKIVGGLFLVLVGVVWMLQGFGASYVPTSFMTNAPEWILIGLVTATIGVYLIVRVIKDQ
jgi:hypothetical protein